MITLEQLRDNINEHIKANPESKDYPVVTFDYTNGHSIEIEEITQHHFLCEDEYKDEFIFDTEEEAIEWKDSNTMKTQKVILL